MRARWWIAGVSAVVVLLMIGRGDPSEQDGSTETSTASERASELRVLHQDGLGGLRWSRETVNVSVTDLEGLFSAAGDFDVRPETDVCGTARHSQLELTAITDSDTGVRALAAEGGFETPEGIGVGSSLEDVRAAYGDAVLAENETVDGTHVFIDDLERRGQQFTPETMLYAFEVDPSDVVRALRAGPMPWVLGCTHVSSETEWPDAVGPGAQGSGAPSAGVPDSRDPGLTAGFSGVGRVQLGGTVEDAGNALGVDFGPVRPLNIDGSCGLAQAAADGLGLVVADPGGVQAVVVARPGIPFVEATDDPVGVGSTIADVQAAFPRWIGSDDKVSLAGGERITVAPQERAGRALLMEADESGVIQQYRVGVDAYVLHEDYCSTSE